MQHQTWNSHRNTTGKYLQCTNEFPITCISPRSKVLFQELSWYLVSFWLTPLLHFFSSLELYVMHLKTIILVPPNLSKTETFANLPGMPHSCKTTAIFFHHQCYCYWFLSKFDPGKKTKLHNCSYSKHNTMSQMNPWSNTDDIGGFSPETNVALNCFEMGHVFKSQNSKNNCLKVVFLLCP